MAIKKEEGKRKKAVEKVEKGDRERKNPLAWLRWLCNGLVLIFGRGNLIW